MLFRSVIAGNLSRDHHSRGRLILAERSATRILQAVSTGQFANVRVVRDSLSMANVRIPRSSGRLTQPEDVARTIAALCIRPPRECPACGQRGEYRRINRMAEDDGLDCLDLLKETPAILRGLIRELSHDDAHWKPAPDRFSMGEIGRAHV